MDFDLSKGINVISGTNGTCKTSLLHMVSNAYQAVTKKCDWLQDAACLDVIKQINSMTNPKIESLTKGDKTYNDPANGAKGTLFTVDYYGQASLEFRKHNSKLSSRYAVKPWYRPGTTEKLPFCPVIYLGLTRLYPFGEYLNDEAVEKLKKNLPVAYQNEIADIYKRLTGISISSVSPQKMGDIKTRADFESDKAGIDSNTISAGEDNLFIIISALVSLKYLHDVTRDDIYLSKAIPVFTEDSEARVFLRILFDYFEETYPIFSQVRRFFHFVNANIGANNLQSVFDDSYLLKATMKCVCILDGDQQAAIDKYTITLPGANSPEKVIMDYALYLYDNDSPFWTAPAILDLNYGKVHFRDNIKPDIDEIPATLQALRAENKSTHGVEREMRKKVFITHQRFFELLFKHWVNDPENSDTIRLFYKRLNIMFKKVAEFYGINPQIWTVN